jgi:hypothetical protein
VSACSKRSPFAGAPNEVIVSVAQRRRRTAARAQLGARPSLRGACRRAMLFFVRSRPGLRDSPGERAGRAVSAGLFADSTGAQPAGPRLRLRRA